MIWDRHESDERARGAIFAALKAHLVTHLLASPGRAAFIVDEAVTVTEDELGARTLGDLVRSTDVDEGENSSERRNGHARATATYAARR